MHSWGIFGKYVLSRVFFLCWVFIMGLPNWLLLWLVRGDDEKLGGLLWFFLPWLGISLVISWTLGKTMARYMADENMLFLDSVRWAWYDLRFKLVFLPLVGQLFVPDEDKTKPDDDDRE